MFHLIVWKMYFIHRFLKKWWSQHCYIWWKFFRYWQYTNISLFEFDFCKYWRNSKLRFDCEFCSSFSETVASDNNYWSLDTNFISIPKNALYYVLDQKLLLRIFFCICDKKVKRYSASSAKTFFSKLWLSKALYIKIRIWFKMAIKISLE